MQSSVVRAFVQFLPALIDALRYVSSLLQAAVAAQRGNFVLKLISHASPGDKAILFFEIIDKTFARSFPVVFQDTKMLSDKFTYGIKKRLHIFRSPYISFPNLGDSGRTSCYFPTNRAITGAKFSICPAETCR
jgi:hypothetical protein